MTSHLVPTLSGFTEIDWRAEVERWFKCVGIHVAQGIVDAAAADKRVVTSAIFDCFYVAEDTDIGVTPRWPVLVAYRLKTARATYDLLRDPRRFLHTRETMTRPRGRVVLQQWNPGQSPTHYDNTAGPQWLDVVDEKEFLKGHPEAMKLV